MCWKRLSLAILPIFIALSIADYLQTYALLEVTNGRVVEGNPIAAAFLDQHGWHGLAMFKLGSVVAVIAVIAILAKRRPPAGAFVAVLGCVALLWVNLHSRNLLAEPVHQQHHYEERLSEEFHDQLPPHDLDPIPARKDGRFFLPAVPVS